MKKSDFDNFVWGSATSSYQIEGAHDIDGKEPSIWDTFTAKGRAKNKEHGKIACDHYHRYEEDIDLMRLINLKAYRFSVSWPRVMVGGASQANAKGLDFYDRLIDGLLKKGIEPFLTLYHWDLPQSLEDQGGWANRDIIQRFSDYAGLLAKKFSDRVSNFITLNEPFIYLTVGSLLGAHAPGRRSPKKFLAGVHHSMMAQAEAARRIKAIKPTVAVGTTNAVVAIQPASQKPKDLTAARRAHSFTNRLYIEPCLGMGYPFEDIPFLRQMRSFILDEDIERLKFDFDFLGINHYTRMLIKRNQLIPFLQYRPKMPSKKLGLTAMKWEIYPEGIYQVLKQCDAYKAFKKIYITENGMALEDEVVEGRVNDERRIDYFRSYLKQILKAKQEGVPVAGYFAWSLLDNFEWAEGYRPRFGLIHVNFGNQKRTLKDSALWFKEFLS